MPPVDVLEQGSHQQGPQAQRTSQSGPQLPCAVPPPAAKLISIGTGSVCSVSTGGRRSWWFWWWVAAACSSSTPCGPPWLLVGAAGEVSRAHVIVKQPSELLLASNGVSGAHSRSLWSFVTRLLQPCQPVVVLSGGSSSVRKRQDLVLDAPSLNVDNV